MASIATYVSRDFVDTACRIKDCEHNLFWYLNALGKVEYFKEANKK
jgi:hypothetical protein